MAKTLLSVAALDFDTASQLEQALAGTFLFGMIFAHGAAHKLQPPEVHALALVTFKDSLHYTDEAAAQGVQQAIAATKPGYHDTMLAIIHRGIDGHRLYQAGDRNALRASFVGILDQFRKATG